MSRLPCSPAGTSPAAIRCASPSTTAVLPTPGSPTTIGLFLLRRPRICITRRISSSRPITGSSAPRRRQQRQVAREPLQRRIAGAEVAAAPRAASDRGRGARRRLDRLLELGQRRARRCAARPPPPSASPAACPAADRSARPSPRRARARRSARYRAGAARGAQVHVLAGHARKPVHRLVERRAAATPGRRPGAESPRRSRAPPAAPPVRCSSSTSGCSRARASFCAATTARRAGPDRKSNFI